MNKMRKKLMITILSMTMLLGCSLAVEAVVIGGTARIAKYSNATVYSDCTAAYLGYATYGASCTKGSMIVTAQQYMGVDNGYGFGHSSIVDANKSVSATTPKTGKKMWRVKVSGSSGRGIGWIKDQ